MTIENSQHSQNPNKKPIGVFDSGLGGLTVVNELAKLMPNEDIVYLGDSARVPYGIKSLETVRLFACQDAAFLMKFDPKLIVVACNTASAAAIDAIRQTCDVEVIDVIAPGARAALKAADGNSPVGVIATEATVASDAYQKAITQTQPDREVLAVPCPLLVPIVEEGRSDDDPIVSHVLCDYLRELQRIRPGALILGCTHYPLLASAIGKLMGPSTTLISSAAAAAREAHLYLSANKLLKHDSASTGSLKCYTTDNPQRFSTLAERFGKRTIDEVNHVGTDELEATDA